MYKNVQCKSKLNTCFLVVLYLFLNSGNLGAMNNDFKEEKSQVVNGSVGVFLGHEQSEKECLVLACYHYFLFENCKNIKEFEIKLRELRQGLYEKAYNEFVMDVKMAVKHTKFLQYMNKDSEFYSVNKERYVLFKDFVT